MKKIILPLLFFTQSVLAMKETPKAISDADEAFRCFLNPYDPSWKSMPTEEKEPLAAIEALDARKDHFDFFSWIKGFDIDVTSNRELALLLIDAHAKKSETGLITNARATKLSWLRTLIEKEKDSPEKSPIVETHLQSTAPVTLTAEKVIVPEVKAPSTILQAPVIQTTSEKDIVVEKEDPAMLMEDQKKADEILAWIRKANQNAIDALSKRYQMVMNILQLETPSCLNHGLKIIRFNLTINTLHSLLKQQSKAISIISNAAVREKLLNDVDRNFTVNREKIISLKIQSLQAYYETLIKILSPVLYERGMIQRISNELSAIYSYTIAIISVDYSTFETILKNSKHTAHTKLIELKNTGNLLLKRYRTCLNGFFNTYKKDPLFDVADSKKSNLISIYTCFSETWPVLFDAPNEKFDE